MEGHGRQTIDDFSNGFPARGLGTEVEYTHPNSVTWPFNQGNLNYKVTDYVDPDHLVSFGRNTKSSAIISTGGEIYIDGSFEFASPECATPAELAIHERAGEQAIMEVIDNFTIREGSGIAKVFKRGGYPKVAPRNVERLAFNNETSIGYHENYTSMNSFTTYDWGDRPYQMRKDLGARCLCDFLALRKLIDGAGMVESDHFSLSQKVPSINFTYYYPDYRMTGKQPFMQKSSRLEIRSGEHSKSDWATEFTIGLTSLVVRLIEHGKYPGHLLLRDANEAVIALISDPHALVMLESGLMMKGADVLKGIVEAADELGQQYPDQYPEYEQKAARNFVDFYDDLQDVSLPDGDAKSLLRINWASRYDYFMRAGVEPDKFDAADPKQLAYDLVYDRVGEKDIARRILSKLGISALRVEMPGPPETRAKTRVDIARRLYSAGELASIEWFQVRSKQGDRHLLGGPLNTEATIAPKI